TLYGFNCFTNNAHTATSDVGISLWRLLIIFRVFSAAARPISRALLAAAVDSRNCFESADKSCSSVVGSRKHRWRTSSETLMPAVWASSVKNALNSALASTVIRSVFIIFLLFYDTHTHMSIITTERVLETFCF